MIDVYSWNINGLRSGLKKGFINWVEKQRPHILCLQETRVSDLQIIKELETFLGYKIFFNNAEKKGYSGTAILTLESPVNVISSTQNTDFDKEGRYILAEFEGFTVINCYVPNGRGNTRVDFKIQFLNFLLSMVKGYSKKPLILCGDFNIAHKEIDLHSPGKNKNKTGFLTSERSFFDSLTLFGYIDVYRNAFPNESGYTWWNQSGKFKQLDLGWRFDYVWIHKKYIYNIVSMERFPENNMSDHCPIKIVMDFLK